MEYLNELTKLMEKRASHSMPLSTAAIHLQNSFSTFFEKPKSLKDWERIIRELVKKNPGVLILTEKQEIMRNPNQAIQLSLDFQENLPEAQTHKQQIEPVCLPSLFD